MLKCMLSLNCQSFPPTTADKENPVCIAYQALAKIINIEAWNNDLFLPVHLLRLIMSAVPKQAKSNSKRVFNPLAVLQQQQQQHTLSTLFHTFVSFLRENLGFANRLLPSFQFPKKQVLGKHRHGRDPISVSTLFSRWPYLCPCIN